MTFDSPANGRAGSSDNSRRILIVDDSVAAAKMLEMLLSTLGGFEIRVAHNGQQALDTAEEFQPHTVLLDIGLPGMDGYEVAARLRGLYGDGMSLVALTGFSAEEDKRRAFEHGFDFHAVKPLSLEQIQGILADADAR